jgi:myo-inositol-1-phosphate synthase
MSEIVAEYNLIDRELFDAIREPLAMVSPRPAVLGPADAPARPGIEVIGEKPKTLYDGALRVSSDIASFRDAFDLTNIIVVYLGSPPRLLHEKIPDSLRTYRGAFAGVHCYLAGAILAGAHFIDFTPSDALDHDGFWRLAAESGVQLAGRDGSTGQTMLKHHVAELFRRRGLHVEAWYSANVLGNNDGRVLSIPQHRELKISDKTGGLPRVLGYAVPNHVVDISYVPFFGDRKESWDAVECSGWLGSPLSLRMDWRGCDSLLAAPMVLDLCRLIVSGVSARRVGLQVGLGFFFKQPLGVDDIRPAPMYDALLKWVDENLADG